MLSNMYINSSSFAEVTLVPPELTSSNSSSHAVMTGCFRSKMTMLIFIASSPTFLLLLPLFILVLCMGYQQQRQHHSTSRPAISHSDAFLHHSIAMELISFLGCFLSFCGSYFNLEDMRFLGINVWYVTWLGQAMFHLLTCVDHYLAVVKPITYLRLRQASGVRIRNVSIGCVWVLSFGWLPLFYEISFDHQMIFHFCNMGFFLIGFSFCSISVLCALKRPGPGEVHGNRERVDQSKLRAFYTILAIMGALLFRIGGNLITMIIYSIKELIQTEFCALFLCDIWFNLSSSLVLPLLFLHRAGKLQCCTPAAPNLCCTNDQFHA